MKNRRLAWLSLALVATAGSVYAQPEGGLPLDVRLPGAKAVTVKGRLFRSKKTGAYFLQNGDKRLSLSTDAVSPDQQKMLKILHYDDVILRGTPGPRTFKVSELVSPLFKQLSGRVQRRGSTTLLHAAEETVTLDGGLSVLLVSGDDATIRGWYDAETRRFKRFAVLDETVTWTTLRRYNDPKRDSLSILRSEFVSSGSELWVSQVGPEVVRVQNKNGVGFVPRETLRLVTQYDDARSMAKARLRARTGAVGRLEAFGKLTGHLGNLGDLSDGKNSYKNAVKKYGH